jgi:hypothetical protein
MARRPLFNKAAQEENHAGGGGGKSQVGQKRQTWVLRNGGFQFGGNMEDARTSFVGPSRRRSEVQRHEEEEALGGRRGEGKAVPS